jgi:hypothetical protein
VSFALPGRVAFSFGNPLAPESETPAQMPGFFAIGRPAQHANEKAPREAGL